MTRNEFIQQAVLAQLQTLEVPNDAAIDIAIELANEMEANDITFDADWGDTDPNTLHSTQCNIQEILHTLNTISESLMRIR